MKVYAIVTGVNGNTNADGTFPLPIDYTISGVDGNGVPANLGGFSIHVSVPVDFSFKKSDRAIRQKVSDDILSRYSISVDPDDIYFPTSN